MAPPCSVQLSLAGPFSKAGVGLRPGPVQCMNPCGWSVGPTRAMRPRALPHTSVNTRL